MIKKNHYIECLPVENQFFTQLIFQVDGSKGRETRTLEFYWLIITT